MSIYDQIQKEIDKSVTKYGQHNSLHETYGLMMEEVAEFFDEVRKKESKRSIINTKKELIQIAAIAIKRINYLEQKTKRKN